MKGWRDEWMRVGLLSFSIPPCFTHQQWQTYFMSHSWSRQLVLSVQTLSKEDPSNINYQGFQENSPSSSAVTPSRSPSFFFFFIISPLPFSSLLSRPLSLARSLSVSPHPSPPLLRVSGKLFFLCLSLMKGCTKLPSLCPCVVGKYPSLFLSSFFLHLSVAASVLHVAQSLLLAPAALWEDCSYICVYCLKPVCNVLCGIWKRVPAFSFFFSFAFLFFFFLHLRMHW